MSLIASVAFVLVSRAAHVDEKPIARRTRTGRRRSASTPRPREIQREEIMLFCFSAWNATEGLVDMAPTTQHAITLDRVFGWIEKRREIGR